MLYGVLSVVMRYPACFVLGFSVLGAALDVEFAIYATWQLSLFDALRGFKCSVVMRYPALFVLGLSVFG